MKGISKNKYRFNQVNHYIHKETVASIKKQLLCKFLQNTLWILVKKQPSLS